MNTKFTITYSTGEYGEVEVSDEVERLIAKGKPFTISSVHPSVAEVLVIKAGDDIDKEKRAQNLIQELYALSVSQHRVDQWQPYTWAEFHPELMKRLVEFM